MLKRKYVNRFYDLFFSKTEKEDLLFLCQDVGLSYTDYLALKTKLSQQGGELFKVNNKNGYFFNVPNIFCGGTLYVDWGQFESENNYKGKLQFLAEHNCVVLIVLYKNKFHYSQGLLDYRVSKKDISMTFSHLRFRILSLLQLRFNIYKKLNAYFTSIKKKTSL